MLRILIIGMHDKIGGVETFLMNYYRNIDREKIQFDFINMYNKLCFQDEIIKLGGKIYNVPNVKRKPIKYYNEIKRIIKENNYKIIHINMLSAANILPVIAAKKQNAKAVIVHSHNSNTPSGYLRKILDRINKRALLKNATDFWACSDLAGRWMFGKSKQFTIINNAIELESFKFNEESRNNVRKKLKLEDKFVIGHIGRFSYQKNHEFLINIFNEVQKTNNNAALLLIGEGELKKQIEAKVKKLGIENKVIFVGITEKVEDYMQAMDIFLLPSRFEGMPVTGIEAQANGVPCIFSNNISSEIKINENVLLIPLVRNQWIKNINRFIEEKINKRNKSEFIENYNIKTKALELQKLYCNLLEENKNILVISPGALPIPAYKGGAVEKLIEEYLDYNEIKKRYNFTVYTIKDENYNEKYNNTKFEYINQESYFYKLTRGVRYIINNKLPKIYVGNAFITQVTKKLKKTNKNYDIIIVENNPLAILNLRKIYPKSKIILHLHNDYLNNKTKKSRKILDNYDEIITVSNYLKNRIQTIYKTDKIKVVYNGIDTELFSQKIDKNILDKYRKKHNIKSEDIVLLYTGRLIKDKGIKELIIATNKLIEKNKNIKLLILGSKASSDSKKNLFIKKLMNIANKDNVYFLGFTKYEELPIYHNISNIQIVPSKWDEPLGNVVIEGLASGINQIVTDDGGIVEIVKNTNVVIIQKYSLKENIYKAVNEMIENKTYLNRNNNYEIIKKFSKKEYIKGMFEN